MNVMRFFLILNNVEMKGNRIQRQEKFAHLKIMILSKKKVYSFCELFNYAELMCQDGRI